MGILQQNVGGEQTVSYMLAKLFAQKPDSNSKEREISCSKIVNSKLPPILGDNPDIYPLNEWFSKLENFSPDIAPAHMVSIQNNLSAQQQKPSVGCCCFSDLQSYTHHSREDFIPEVYSMSMQELILVNESKPMFWMNFMYESHPNATTLFVMNEN